MLRIALRHLDDLGTHFDELAACLLPTATARFADRQGYLIRSSSFISWTSENLARQKQQRRVVVERRAGIAP
jgi:hypothetical protein